eukprot:TRINITY_DN3816_c0_g1_i1.p1 TRINITY_DN3816_c0_g1~~TRINITY_DN3816_c0_g1_i1.p1  ORF type:complete len:111 (-),score=1.21 TRINITY_DN3816_c0_g1_i1:77-409(-)
MAFAIVAGAVSRAMFVAGVVLLSLLLHLSPNGASVDAALCGPGVLDFTVVDFDEFKEAWNTIRVDPLAGTCDGKYHVAFLQLNCRLIDHLLTLPPPPSDSPHQGIVEEGS